ncbi:MAG: aldehyde dehydrogenase family protein [Gemmatimonadaceae bacterium]|nr:aldehyde dehydrogenase family protein [Gemmatimonadaceae bacterium]
MSGSRLYSSLVDLPASEQAAFDAALIRMKDRMGESHALFINGADRETHHFRAKHSPIDRGLVLGQFATATEHEAEEAMQAAVAAYPAWRRTPASERIDILRRVAAIIVERRADFAAVLAMEVGKNRAEALGEAHEAAEFFTTYCDEWEKNDGVLYDLPSGPSMDGQPHSRRVLKPYGAWLVLASFNFPLALLAGPTAAALLAGNTVIAKGAADTPWSGRLLADAFRDAGVPPGVFNYLSGASADMGDALISHPQLAGLTVSASRERGSELARRMSHRGGVRPCIAELGALNACVVTAHADIDRAAMGIIHSAFGMSGQKHSSLAHVYAHGAIADELFDQIRLKLRFMPIGDPTKRGNYLGPVTKASSYSEYRTYVHELREHGSHVLAGGEVLTEHGLGHGQFVAPTIAEAPLGHALWKVEMFLPILLVHRVHGLEDATTLMNTAHPGLNAGVYGNPTEVDWFFEHVDAGLVYANQPLGSGAGTWPGYHPISGWKDSDASGKTIGSFDYLAQYLRQQAQSTAW